MLLLKKDFYLVPPIDDELARLISWKFFVFFSRPQKWLLAGENLS